MTLHGYRNLRVWHAAVELAIECYHRTAGFPAAERYGLTAQMRDAAVSVVSNIAEGHGRGTNRAFRAYLSQANGSLKELESQTYLSWRLSFLSREDARTMIRMCSATGAMLHGLRESLEE